MKSVGIIAMVTIILVVVLAGGSGGIAWAAEEVTVEELVANMEEFDEREVTISGEAVGDVMLRDDHGWVTVNDDAYSVESIHEGGDLTGYSNWGIGVWAPRTELEGIQIMGGYKYKGDQVRVTGVFHRACQEHGGDTDIHANRVEVLEPGHPISHPFAHWKLILVLVLAMLVMALGYVWWKRTHPSLPRGWRG
jgi:hypothetical protein